MLKSPAGKLGRVGRGVERAVIGERLDAHRSHLAVLVGGDFGVDVIVAREGVGLQILGAVFDPLDRLAGRDRGDRSPAHSPGRPAPCRRSRRRCRAR